MSVSPGGDVVDVIHYLFTRIYRVCFQGGGYKAAVHVCGMWRG
jgi:hypothetical protein